MKLLSKKEIKKFVQKESKRDFEIVLLLENIEYARNVASIFRTADAAGVRKMYLTGISQQPPFGKDLRKTSRNSEDSVQWEYEKDTGRVIQKLKNNGFKIISVELTDKSIPMTQLKVEIGKSKKVCFILGSEVYGVKNSTLERSDIATYIPMYGRNASLNV